MVLAMEDACPNGVEVAVESPPDAAGTGEQGETGDGSAREGVAAEPTEGADTSGAMQQVLDNLGELPTSTGAKDIDLIFLRGIMESPIAHERLEDVRLEAVQDNNMELVTDILGDITALSVRDDSAAELSRILQEPHFQSLLEAHDMVASKCYEAVPPAELSNEALVNSALMQADAVRMIGIRKKAGEPLGVTFRVEKEELVIARILHGGMIDRQGLLHVGDIIKEVNGRDVGNNPTELQEMLKDCSGGITLKILPSYRDAPAPPQVYVQPHFDYDPANDHLIPCREAGIGFKRGDLLQIVNREDPNWWQACHVVGGATGLIPSQFLEEKRKAFVPRDFDGSGILCGTITGKKKKKMMYLTARNAEFDRHELQIYEEVAKMPPFQRKTLVLIGAQGVGRRSLKNRLVVLNPTHFGTTIPFTSRRPRDDELDGNSYQFVTRTEMEADVKAGRYLEHGEYDGNLYGTKMDSIHEVVDTRRTCILDVNPQALKVLKTAEFMPYVVFIAAPEFETLKAMHKATVDAGIATKQLTDVDLRKTVDESARIQRAYNHYFDLIITNDNLDRAFETLQAAVDKLCSEPQWVPVNWVY
ncbi:protein PALS2 isoform X2 [Salmo salar]|uniref:Protein PALS2 isoform X2 n=2 Tax=Salmo salar TaxID=8030 RepID=A0A1S3M622_SALSA|nr:protein PALS2 isoform X2 [Salmo salar]|eukprot:XP_013998431.1 PREDICTED: MAGUK p55 subfamily member 6-like isoform X2 [Salmo salar]